VDIRAPHDGVVLQSSVHTLGGVVAPGEQIMLIVPQAEALTIEGTIAPQEINQLRIG
jgi:HlyD family secretion protein